MQDLQYNPLFVTVLGMATVFVGLVCLIYISKLMSFFVKSKQEAPVAASTPEAAAMPASKAQFVAAVSAAIATEMGAEVSGIRIHAIRKL